MNIYKVLNEITEYIDNHLEEKIEYDILAKMMGVNAYTLQRIFSLIAGLPLAEYIRKRRLSMAAGDLLKEKARVMDVAIKYQYDNATSFSRAFENFHEIKPSQVKSKKVIKNFPRIIFNEDVKKTNDIQYKIVELEEMILYGKGIKCTNATIGKLAPKFFSEMKEEYTKLYGDIKYGMITYDDTHDLCDGYYCLYDKEIKEFEKFVIPKSKWLVFFIASQEPIDIQDISHRFYLEFAPSSRYKLRGIPELEYYHDDVTEFLVPID